MRGTEWVGRRIGVAPSILVGATRAGSRAP